MDEHENLPAPIDVGQHLPATTDISVGHMLQSVIDKGISQENVAAFEKLVDLHVKMQDRAAEQEFARAFVALQGEMPAIKAMRPVPNNDGSVRYKFAPFESIMEQVSPHLQRHGFTVSFSTDYAENRLVKICTLQHISGHSKQTRFAVRIGKGPPGSNETQADGAASTYAKRYAFCEMLNITIDRDKDANADGDCISPEQADSLRQRVYDVKADEERFLKYAQAASYEEIPSSMYVQLDQMLRQKEEKAKREPPR